MRDARAPMRTIAQSVDAMVLWGDPETIVSGLRAHLEAGADQICIQPVHAEGDTEARDRTLAALANV
jgi:alkanesulfonate monooxygenase SsuD/methylene tetrahydromethanopterin reductase-like flavin-dependent oxidoreductase (luciferase family)